MLLNFAIKLDFGDLTIALTERQVDNHKYLDFGILNEKVIIIKEDKSL